MEIDPAGPCRGGCCRGGEWIQSTFVENYEITKEF